MTSYSASAPGNLPAEPNSFVGRERDLADLVAILGRVRAVTLCGPGGIGKTRLALRLAAMLAPGYPDGAWLVDLADVEPVADIDLAGGGHDRLVPLVTAALGIRQEPDRQLADTLAEALRPRQSLLILDTCEHLVQESAALVQRLLAGCPGLRVIATSRAPLGVRGEIIWRVPPLGLPPDAGQHAGGSRGVAPPGQHAGGSRGVAPPGQHGGETPPAEDVAGYEAVMLFVERAAAVRPGFELNEGTRDSVARICRTLDGVPLAIELAAARIRALSADQIADRLADQFALLAMGDRAAPLRHQTLRATVEWSYQLLTPPERLLLSRLSVFHGWDLEMAEQVCAHGHIAAAEVLHLLRALIDKSLVSVDADASGGARYRLLDTVRELAAGHAEASAELDCMRVAHRDCMLAIAEQIAGVAFVRGEPSWPERVAMYHRVRADRANFNAALACCVQRGDADEGLRLCHALSGSWLASGDGAEGASWLDRLLAMSGEVSAGVRARALAVRAELAFELVDYAGAAEYARAGLDLSSGCEDGNPAGALRLLALTDLMSGRAADALEHADAAVAAARQMANDWEEGMSLAARAAAVATSGDLTAAEQELRHALDVLRDNNGWGVANVLAGLGQIARAREDLAGAVTYLRDALALYRQIDARPEMARCLAGIGLVALAQQDLPAAAASLAESVRLSLVTGQRLAIARGLQALSGLAEASGELSHAVRLAGAAQSVFETSRTRPSAAASRRTGRLLDTARAALGLEAVSALLAEGRAMSPPQAAQLIRVVRDEPAQPAHARQRAGVSLTEREVEVAMLVARGMSNRAIGEKLFITTATAARHIANIFTKVGVGSRAQLAAWMAENWPDSGD